MIEVKEFKERRHNLIEKLNDFSIGIMFCGCAKKRSEDENYDFFANRNFYYLTNIEQENSIYVFVKTCGTVKEYLFLSECDPVKEKWYGKRLTLDEGRELSGIENVLFIDSFNSKINTILKEPNETYGFIENIYLDFDSEQKISDKNTIETYIHGLQANFDNRNYIDLYPFLRDLRMIKSKQEVTEFKEAVSKTNIAIRNVMRKAKPGMYEYQLSSLFYYSIQDYDFSELSFPTICASGVNATTLHYPTPTAKIKDGDLVLLDLGCKNNGYCADISRTFPVNGKFSKLQKTIYEIVLEANKKVINMIRPGITIKQLNDFVTDFMAEKCLKAKLIDKKEDIKKYYFHNVSHHIGLDTHDISDRNLPLKAGNIISDEPGLYFKELGIGVRIEDDILVTEEGSYNLSGNIIKEVDEIENFLSSRHKLEESK